MSVNPVLHSAEVHWIGDNAGVAWSYNIIHRICKETINILPKG